VHDKRPSRIYPLPVLRFDLGDSRTRTPSIWRYRAAGTAFCEEKALLGAHLGRGRLLAIRLGQFL
jgi:hypothetical protein